MYSQSHIPAILLSRYLSDEVHHTTSLDVRWRVRYMKSGNAIFLTILILVGIAGATAADRLPNQTPENQVFSVDTVINTTGEVASGINLGWDINSPGPIETGTINSENGVIAIVAYKDSILTNGGKLSENNNFNFDSGDKTSGLYNVESQKVLTYASTQGAHMIGEEEYILNIAGVAKNATDNIRCVFSTYGSWLPPFCNIVSVKSTLINVNSAQISTRGQLRAVAATDDIPAELNYQIALTPDANSGSSFAKGSVKTVYAGSVMEGRDSGLFLTSLGAEYMNDNYGPGSPFNLGDTGSYTSGDQVPQDLIRSNNDYLWFIDSGYAISATNTWKDSATATGDIKNFLKAFAYNSGLKT